MRAFNNLLALIAMLSHDHPNANTMNGVPFEVLSAETSAHDLIVLGKDANFDIHPKADAEELVADLLKSAGRPLLVVPSVDFSGEDVLVAYDGSPPADRALQLAVLLGSSTSNLLQYAPVPVFVHH